MHTMHIFKVERKTAGETFFFFIYENEGKKILSCRHTDSSSLILRFLNCCQTKNKPKQPLKFIAFLILAFESEDWYFFFFFLVYVRCAVCMVYEEWSRLMFQFLLAKILQFTMLHNPYIWMYFCQIFGFELWKNGFFAYRNIWDLI